MEIRESFENTMSAFRNVIHDLFDRNKWLYAFCILILFLLLIAFKNSESIRVFILCIIISTISLSIYIETRSSSETSLSFILGLFTVFSTEWNVNLFILFISFYIIFNVIIFLISALSLAAKRETLLIQASLKYRGEDNKLVYKELLQIAESSSQKSLLDPIERAKCVHFLAYRNIKREVLKSSINMIELIKTVQNCNLEDSISLFYDLYALDVISCGHPYSEKRLERMMDEIVTIPLTHNEFIYLFQKLKSIVHKGELSFSDLMKEISIMIYAGSNPDEVVSSILDR